MFSGKPNSNWTSLVQWLESKFFIHILKLFFFSNQAISKIIHKKQQWETITGETSSYYTIDSKCLFEKTICHIWYGTWIQNDFSKKVSFFEDFFSNPDVFLNMWYLEFFDIFSCWLLTTPEFWTSSSLWGVDFLRRLRFKTSYFHVCVYSMYELVVGYLSNFLAGIV